MPVVTKSHKMGYHSRIPPRLRHPAEGCEEVNEGQVNPLEPELLQVALNVLGGGRVVSARDLGGY